MAHIHLQVKAYSLSRFAWRIKALSAVLVYEKVISSPELIFLSERTLKEPPRITKNALGSQEWLIMAEAMSKTLPTG